MTWLILAAAALVAWEWHKGRLRKPTRPEMLAATLAVVGVIIAAKGKPLFSLPLLVGAAIILNRGRKQAAPAPAMPVDEARILLDLPPQADASAIRAAHRRLIARVHPDAGGSEDLARRVNAARDTLLADLNRKPPRAS